MIAVKGLAKRYGAQELFSNGDARFDPGKRYGIVGANGTGKSTLLRILTGEESADEGEVHFSGKPKMGTLNQDHFAFEAHRILDVVMQGKKALWEAMDEKERILDDPDAPVERFSELEEIIADNDGYVAESRISEMLEGLGIPTSKHFESMKVLSGGYKLRVLLAQCLFSDPDVLLLDEPTNHLDILSIRWLEDYLRQFRGVVILISHDREFLNRICTHTVDIDYGTIKLYTGNYDQFLEAKALDEEMRRIEAEKAEKRIGELQAFVTKFKAKASKARQAQSKARMIERMEKDVEEPVYTSRCHPTIRFQQIRPSGKTVVEVRDLAKSFGDHQVLSNLSFDIFRQDKVAIIGPNGVGKSTLLKILLNQLPQDQGEFKWGHETHPQYFSQDHSDSISPNSTPYEWLHNIVPTETIGAVRSVLGQLLFSGDDVDKTTAALSGGEAARLVLAKMVMLKGNVLVLDEPTNHLDMESIESLLEALQKFDGTVLLVSHNRYLVRAVATKILELKPDGYQVFDGDYDAYLEKAGEDHLSYQVELANQKKKSKKQKETSKPAVDKRKAAEQRKAFNKESKPLREAVANLEAAIESLEEDLEAVNDLFSDPNYFTKTSPEEIRLKNLEKKDLEEQLGQKMTLWEEKNTQLEVLKETYQQT